MITEAFVDGANALAETPRSAPEILPPEGTSAPLLPNGDQLRALAENILDSGQQSLVDYIANPTTKRQQAVAVNLADVDAPEIDQAYGPEAKELLENLLLGAEVRVVNLPRRFHSVGEKFKAAAALAARENKGTREIDVAMLQERLVAAGAILAPPPADEVDVGNPEW